MARVQPFPTRRPDLELLCYPTGVRPPEVVAGRPAGYFALAQLPTGTYTVTVAQSGRVVETAVVRVTAGGTVTQDLTLPSAGGGG